jgi:ABC-2 type transport system ATP-binding protein
MLPLSEAPLRVGPAARVYGPDDSAVLFAGVTKAFAGRDAVRDLDLRVPRGAVYGLLGPNGAGKTTSIRMLMGILGPDRGRIEVLGGAPSVDVKDRIGYLPEERGLYVGMRVIDNLAFFGSVRGLSRADARRRGERWLDRLGLVGVATRKLQELSKGNQQKVQFAATVLHDPDLLVLDEPFSGLDPLNQDLLRRTILDLAAAGTTIILSTHAMEEVERVCTHITLLNEGRVLVDGELDDVKGRWGEDTLRIDAAGDPRPLERHPWVKECRSMGRTLEVSLQPGHDPAEFLAQVAAVARVRRFEIRTPSLHSIFVRLVSGAGEPGAGAVAAREREVAS